MTPDTQLLTRYATERDEAAFAELTQRHLDHVHSTAIRLVGGDAHLAEDVSQAVFAELARNARSLNRLPVLSGWLHTTARFMAAKLVRGEQRRRQREQTALCMTATDSGSEPDWQQIRAFLDDSIGELNDTDRDALMLRYFEKKPLAAVGAALGVSEDAARMRVDRAIDRLRTRLTSRGVTSTAAALSTVLAQNLVSISPPALGARITAQALASVAAGTTGGAWVGSLALGKIAIAAAVLVIVGTIGLLKFRPPPPSASPVTSDLDKAVQAPPDQPPLSRFAAGSPTVADPNTDGLTLLFVDAQTGLPVTNQAVDLKAWERGAQLLVKKTAQLTEGRASVPFETNAGPDFRIYAHLEGYADVHLRWRPKRGETIPDSYTVRLIRPALIRGRVVDTSGKPVGGATLGFNTEEVAAPSSVTEDHTVDYLTVTTDAEGFWEIQRLAPEMVRRLYGSASHPDYSRFDTPHASRKPEFAQQLLDGTAVFRLPEGIVVRGTVLDENGRPIGSARVRVGHMGSSQSRETHTESDGSFTVRGCQAGEGLVTAEAEGYAPSARALSLEPNLAPVQLILGAGRTLRMRVVDPQRNPIAGASVGLDSFPRGERVVPIPQVRFRGTTDAEGRLLWEAAPDQPLDFYVTAPGYVRRDDVLLSPDEDKEHLVTLSPAFVISGTVRNAATRDLISNFRMGMGWPELGPAGAMQARWSDIDRFWLKFSGGEFRHVVEEMVIGGSANQGHIFRFEADGHKPFVTRVYQPDEGEVQIDVELEPAEDIAAIAYTVDGKPAPAAQIAFVSPGHEVRLVPGGFAGDLGHALAWLRRGGDDGGFTVPDDEAIERVIVVTPGGYAEATLDQLRKVRAVRLGSWCAISGTLACKGQPVAGAEVRLLWKVSPMILSFQTEPVPTDSAGRFTFRQVPPGSFEVSATPGAADGDCPTLTASIELDPGETKQFVLSDSSAQSQ